MLLPPLVSSHRRNPHRTHEDRRDEIVNLNATAMTNTWNHFKLPSLGIGALIIAGAAALAIGAWPSAETTDRPSVSGATGSTTTVPASETVVYLVDSDEAGGRLVTETHLYSDFMRTWGVEPPQVQVAVALSSEYGQTLADFINDEAAIVFHDLRGR